MGGLKKTKKIKKDRIKKKGADSVKTLIVVMAVMAFLLARHAWALQELSDVEMEQAQGQALFSMDRTAGTGISSDMAFYKLQLQGVLSLNANIRKLQLGCGGINGPGCDIDIDNLSFSGAGCSPRPSCDAVFTNPFIEFAIKNDGNSAQRQITGFRFSAERLKGLMTAGINDGTANGINTFSGYMNIAATTGSTSTKVGYLTNTLTGRAYSDACTSGCPGFFYSNNSGLRLDSLPINFNVPAFAVNGRRMTSVRLNTSAVIPPVPLTPGNGSRSITISDCLGIAYIQLCNASVPTIYFNTSIINTRVSVAINEGLGYLHSIPLDTPFSLSLQKADTLWPGEPVAAQRGWWMATKDPLNVGHLSTPAGYQVDISQAYAQIANTVSAYLWNNPVYVPLTLAVQGILGFPITADVAPIDLGSYTPISAAFSNLPLGSTQNVVPNCYGNSKFC